MSAHDLARAAWRHDMLAVRADTLSGWQHHTLMAAMYRRLAASTKF
jgi:uncharacterized protein YjaG (DUF416 family)